MAPQSSQTAKDFGPIQLARAAGLATWQLERARARGLVPPPDLDDSRWSAPSAQAVIDEAAAIADAVGTAVPLGSTRLAGRIGTRIGLEVTGDDIDTLAEQGWLTPVGYFKGWPLYDVRLADDLPTQLVTAVVHDRLVWLESSLTRWDAAQRLGWQLREFDDIAARRDMRPGRLGRFAKADIDTLADDDELVAQVTGDRLIGPEQAAARLQIRRTDFDYAETAGFVAANTYTDIAVGRYRTVRVPLYRTKDVDAVLTIAEVDWDEVRACKPGERSPLRDLVPSRPPTRAQIIRRWVASTGARYEIEIFAIYHIGADRWEIDWERRDERPTLTEIEESIADDPVVAQYRPDMRLGAGAGSVVRWAREMLEPQTAVILDTETTDLFGRTCEIAVIDAHTGRTLLDTLVNPGCPIGPEATGVHGITDDDVGGAPTWAEVLPKLLQATKGKRILAYNSDYDLSVVASDCRTHGLEPEHLGEADNWACLMTRRSEWLCRRRWLPLEGGHRAADDCRSALEVLRELTAPARRSAH